MWGGLDGIYIKERRLGKGTIYRGKLLADIIQLPPDFEYTSTQRDAAIRFTHRQTSDTDIYFVSNRLRRPERITAEFRVKGRQPELWNAEDGSIAEAAMYEETAHGIRMPMTFSPAGSWIVVFRKPLNRRGIQSMTLNGKTIAESRPAVMPAATQWMHVRNTFSIEAWIKPDTFAMPGKGYVVYPPEGEDIGGRGFACAGIAAGQQQVRICERTKGAAYFAKDVISVQQPLSGWTHVVAVYRDGAPSLYINGKLAGSAVASGFAILPGVGTKPSGELYSSVFEGNQTTPKLHHTALGLQQIGALYAAGLPAPGLPEGLDLQRQNDRLAALVWQNGRYAVDGKEIIVTDKCAVQAVKGSWKVRFEEGRGAPDAVVLPALSSLHLHADMGVRHFSGVAVYEKRIQVKQSALQQGKRIWLHLGRVEVVAKVEVNGKDAGICWKEPYMLDITQFLKSGANYLRIQVATLWPNRQIGDELLPPENEYTSANYIASLPEWFLENRPNPGSRSTFATWNNYRAEDPLLASGLLGPVRLVTAWYWEE